MNSHPALSTEQQVCTHCYQKHYSVLSRFHQSAVHRMSTAHFSLCAFFLKVCFVLITSKSHHFIPEPLICLCRQWDMKRHFWHLFPICAPTQKPPEQVLFRFHLLSACLSPRSPAVQGKPRSYLSKETDKNNMCALRERDREGKVVSDLVTSTQKWGRQAAEIYISWRLTNGLPPLLFHYYHSALLCGPEACQTPQEPRWAFTVKMQTTACIIPVLS